MTQSLILASGEGEATAELAREAKNIFGLPGARIADYLFNQLFGWGIVFALSYLAFLFAHLIWRPRIAALPLRHELPHQWLPPALDLRSSCGPAVALPLRQLPALGWPAAVLGGSVYLYI